MDEQNAVAKNLNNAQDELNRLMQQMNDIDSMVAYMNRLKIELDGEDAADDDTEPVK